MSSSAFNKKSARSRQRLFVSDLKSLLYAFGDSSSPNVETIHFLEDILTSYLLDVLTSANQIRFIQERSKLKVDDLKFALRKDSTKLGRIQDLLRMDSEISNAKKLFDEADKAKVAKEDVGVGGKRRHGGTSTRAVNRKKRKSRKRNNYDDDSA